MAWILGMCEGDGVMCTIQISVVFPVLFRELLQLFCCPRASHHWYRCQGPHTSQHDPPKMTHRVVAFLPASSHRQPKAYAAYHHK